MTIEDRGISMAEKAKQGLELARTVKAEREAAVREFVERLLNHDFSLPHPGTVEEHIFREMFHKELADGEEK